MRYGYITGPGCGCTHSVCILYAWPGSLWRAAVIFAPSMNGNRKTKSDMKYTILTLAGMFVLTAGCDSNKTADYHFPGALGRKRDLEKKMKSRKLN